VDLQLLLNSLGSDSGLYLDAGIAEATERLRESLQQTIVERRSTRPYEGRCGVMAYFPLVPSDSDLEDYRTLLFSREQPGWSDFVAHLRESGSSMIQVSGSVTWPGHEFHHLYLFLNSAQVGSPVIALTSLVTISTGSVPDSASFQVSFGLNEDSASAFVGLFEDLDNDQHLSSGDRYGYYHVTSPLRDWLTLHGGDQLEGVNIQLNRSY
jgi:hypothetical protein